VVLAGRKVEKLEAVEAEIRADGGEASHVAVDIREEEAVKAAVAGVVAARGRIHGLVNNAGGSSLAARLDLAKGWQTVLATNLTGGFLVARECYCSRCARTAARS